MMAITALHIAYLKPTGSESYLLRASHHHTLALPLIASALTKVTEENCHALHCCGHLVTKFAFAVPRGSSALFPTLNDELLSEWFSLVRGAYYIYTFALEWLSAGPLRSSLEISNDLDAEFSQNPTDSHYARLLLLFPDISSGDDIACREAVNILRKGLALAAHPDQTIPIKTFALLWPARIPQHFIEMMNERKPKALVVLAHYCVMLKMIESFWFMNGCAARLLHPIRAHLSEEWLPHTAWPLLIIESA
jgi:hypothetical protein